jgi:hypothetical protein
MVAMSHTIELWLWRVTDPVSGRTYVTRYRMSEANALDFDPAAERVPGSREVRELHESPRAPNAIGRPRPQPVRAEAQPPSRVGPEPADKVIALR